MNTYNLKQESASATWDDDSMPVIKDDWINIYEISDSHYREYENSELESMNDSEEYDTIKNIMKANNIEYDAPAYITDYDGSEMWALVNVRKEDYDKAVELLNNYKFFGVQNV